MSRTEGSVVIVCNSSQMMWVASQCGEGDARVFRFSETHTQCLSWVNGPVEPPSLFSCTHVLSFVRCENNTI